MTAAKAGKARAKARTITVKDKNGKTRILKVRIVRKTGR